MYAGKPGVRPTDGSFFVVLTYLNQLAGCQSLLGLRRYISG